MPPLPGTVPQPGDENFDLWQLGQQTGQLPWRGMSEQSLDQFNRTMKASPVWQNFMLSQGLPTSGNIRLTDQQQRGLEQALKAAGFPISGGMHIDAAGHVNQQNRGPRNAALAAAVIGGGYLGGTYLAPLLAGGGGAAGAGGAAGGATGGGGAAGTAGLLAQTPAQAAAASGAFAGGAPFSTALAAPALAGAGGGAALTGDALAASAFSGGAPITTAPLATLPTGVGLGDVAGGAPYTDADWQGPLQSATGGGGGRNWFDRAGDLGQILGGAAGQSAEERYRDNLGIGQRNAALANIFGTQQTAASRALEARADEQARLADLDLKQRQFGLDAPVARGKQSVRGSLMANLQPASFSGLPEGIARTMPTITGGLTPAAFSPETRQLGAELSRQALVNQLKGDTFDPLTPTNFQSGLLPKPELEAVQRSSALDKIIGGAGLGASLLGGIGQVGNIYARQRRG